MDERRDCKREKGKIDEREGKGQNKFNLLCQKNRETK